jgi:hypothetical protein
VYELAPGSEDDDKNYQNVISLSNMKTVELKHNHPNDHHSEIETNIDFDGTPGKKRLVTVDQAFEICGGFGKFQKISAAVLILVMGLSQCFLYSFPFLELEPKYECMRNKVLEKWVPCDPIDFCNDPTL